MKKSMDEQLLKKRFLELSQRAYTQGIYTFTEFLDMSQMTLFYQTEKELGKIPYTVYGGAEDCERLMIRFGSEELLGYEMGFPIVCIHCRPLLKKFSDELTHRDFLGAIMNLGIERDTLGDLMIENKECYLFCLESIAPYIIENLTKVKHTTVICTQTEGSVWQTVRSLEDAEAIVPSERIDAVLSKICHLSRSQCVVLFREKKVFVNGRQCENNTYILKKEDVISVRGVGKLIYSGIIYTTKKDKLRIRYQRYV